MAPQGNHSGSVNTSTGERWQRVKEIFSAALECAPGERSIFLNSECGEDVELRREVESLLESHDEAGDFIEKPPQELAPLLETKTLVPLGPGMRVGAYRLVRELGEGGMGSVYLAVRADEEFQKRVAIKLIRPGLVSDFIVQRFRGERQILARLEHANIARLIDGGTENGLPYLVMEYVEGIPITEYAKANANSRAVAVECFLKACSAVQYAHERQVIHRDLKPNNILIKKDGSPKLLDFGIAKMLNAEPGQSLQTTLVGVRMLTPAYASPEQLRGDQSTVASDIYSLGIVLHEVLSGARPERPGTASTDLPSPLRQIVIRATQEMADDRYVSVEAMAAELRVWLTGQSLAAEPTSVAVLPFWAMQAGDTDSMLGLALADAIITQLSNNPAIRVRSTASVKKWGSETDPVAVAAELGVDYVLEGHLRHLADRLRVTVQLIGIREKAPVWAAQFEEPSGDLLSLEDELARQIGEAASQQLSGAGVRRTFQKRTVKPAAYQAYLKGRWYFAKCTAEDLSKALVCFSQAIAEDPLYALAHAGIADYHIWQAMWGGVSSGESIAAAKVSAQKAVELDASAAEAHACLGWTCWAASHDAEGAERTLKHAIQLKPSLGRTHQWLGILYSMQGRHEEAIACLERARETDPECPWYAGFQALCFYYAHDYQRALE
ncbi:MAG: protein kinase, partial [Acidobacteriaceae bacterium]|nr:protein kinase [Acidobacteriaceae bacterium]